MTLAAATGIRVDTSSFLAIVVTSAVAGTLAAIAGGRNVFIPVVVAELGLGIVIGPQALRWLLSLAIAYAIGGVLAALGVVLSIVFVGSALSTTAIGTPLPILSDTGELRTRFGTYLLAAGAAGDFGPILLITLVLSAQSPLHNALILVAFVALAIVVAASSSRSCARTAAASGARITPRARRAVDRRPRVRARPY